MSIIPSTDIFLFLLHLGLWELVKINQSMGGSYSNQCPAVSATSFMLLSN